jgi:5'-methylthioadenosine phosphorylase
MNLVPEVFFAREIGACYAALELVSNYGEGLVSREWSGHDAFGNFLDSWSPPASEAILHALRNMDVEDDSCGCSRYRWKTIIE